MEKFSTRLVCEVDMKFTSDENEWEMILFLVMYPANSLEILRRSFSFSTAYIRRCKSRGTPGGYVLLG